MSDLAGQAARIHPWPPMRVHQGNAGIDVSVWGRTYRFGNRPLPTSIESAGREILAGPVRLVGELDGEPMDWTGEYAGIMLHSHNDAQTILVGYQRCQRLVLNTAVWIDFDGAMFIDVKVMPGEGVEDESPLVVPRLHLEIALRAEAATLFHYWPHRGQGILLDHTADNSGGTPAERMALPFKPFVWLGWEEGGLSWFAESAKGWQPADADRAIEVDRDGDTVLLRLRLLDSEPAAWKDQPLTWARRPGPLLFRMGLQATPVKPWPADLHKQRVAFHSSHHVAESRDRHQPEMTAFERMLEDGINTVIFHEGWQPIQNYGFSDEPEKVRQAVDLCHDNGMKVLAYFGYELASLAPEWGDVADEVLALNPDGVPAGGWRRHPHQRDYVCCTKSIWGDELVRRIIESMETFGFDGLYLDQTNVPFGCCNERHGCGWRDAAGRLQPTYPIRTARTVMRRLYDYVHPRGGWIELHQSSCCVTPTLAFAHSYYDGEHLHWEGKFRDDPLNTIGLEAFRAEFMGWNFGVPADYMASGEKQAFPLVHGLLNRPLPTKAETRHRLWEAFETFNVGSAEFLGYWRSELPVSAAPETVKASAYVRRTRGDGPAEMLMVVANLSGDRPVDAQVTVDLSALGLDGGASAHDVIADKPVPADNGRLGFQLEPLDFRVIRLAAT